MLDKLRSKLIDDYKKFLNLWSVRFFILIGISPDLYNAISSMGMLDQAPPIFIWIVRSLAIAGISSRLIKQGDKNANNSTN